MGWDDISLGRVKEHLEGRMERMICGYRLTVTMCI